MVLGSTQMTVLPVMVSVPVDRRTIGALDVAWGVAPSRLGPRGLILCGVWGIMSIHSPGQSIQPTTRLGPCVECWRCAVVQAGKAPSMPQLSLHFLHLLKLLCL